MKKYFLILVFSTTVFSCVSIPKETIELSQTLGNDLKVLQTSHRNAVSIYYQKIKDNINLFIKDVYAPFIINYVLDKELNAFKNGAKKSLFLSLNDAATTNNAKATEKATKEMQDFLEAANRQIEKKKAELINPILSQETTTLLKIDQSYQNARYANATITAYLKSVRKVKETQQEALEMIGLKGADSILTNKLVLLSDGIKDAIEKGKEIDTKSTDALDKIEEITTKIKELTNKNN